MAFFTNLFGGKKTLSHHAKTLVDFFRASAPTSLKKLSDTDIYDAAQEVMGLFKLEHERIGLSITNEHLANVALQFLIHYEEYGKKKYRENLQYNIEGFRAECAQTMANKTAKNIADQLSNDSEFKKQAINFILQNIATEIKNNPNEVRSFATENIDALASNIAELINNEIESKEMGRQFILEELDAARHGNDFAVNFVKNSGLHSSEYIGAMEKTKWEGEEGELEKIQHLMRSFTYQLSDRDLMCALNLAVVDKVMMHWEIGKYDISSDCPF